MYAHYREEQERIGHVHDVLNLLIFGFFCVLVMFEDIVFLIFPNKKECLTIFPLLMLAVVFNILCEGTVYGNSANPGMIPLALASVRCLIWGCARPSCPASA